MTTFSSARRSLSAIVRLRRKAKPKSCCKHHPRTARAANTHICLVEIFRNAGVPNDAGIVARGGGEVVSSERRSTPPSERRLFVRRRCRGTNVSWPG